MTDPVFSKQERQQLLSIARSAIKATLNQEQRKPLEKDQFPKHLTDELACFVTLTIHGRLRGCIGSLEAFRPLVDDVQDRAIQAAFEDYRFPPLTLSEFDQLQIEISVLTKPENLNYNSPVDLPTKIHPNVDGVILRDGPKRATFLPQVWDQIPSPTEFLSALCSKMGARANLWQTKMLDVATYQVEEFSESITH